MQGEPASCHCGHWGTYRRPCFRDAQIVRHRMRLVNRQHAIIQNTPFGRLTGNSLKYTERLPMMTIVPSLRERM